jgi:hypothetical protein
MDPASSTAVLLAAGATALAKDALTSAVGDAYVALKDRLRARYPAIQIDRLEQNPESKARRAMVEEDLTAARADQDAELPSLAQKFAVALQSTSPKVAAAIGVDVQGLTAANIYLSDIRAGRDIQISGIVSDSGNIVIGTATTGIGPAEPWPQPGKPRK